MNNPYALLPLANFIITAGLITHILAQKHRDARSTSFIAYAAAIAGWSLIEHLLWAYFPAAWHVAVMKLNTLTWQSIVFLFMNFSYILLGRKRDIPYYVLLAITVLSIAISLSSNLVVAGSVRHYWGPAMVYGPLFQIITFFVIILPSLYIIFLLARAIIHESAGVRKVQYQLVLTGSTITVLIGVATNMIIPTIFGINDLIKLASTGTLIQGLLIFIAITRYKLLSIDIDVVAEDLFANTHEAVLIANPDGEVMRINPAARSFLVTDDQTAADIQGAKLNELLPGILTSGYGNDLFETHIGNEGNQRILSVSRAKIIRSGQELGETVSLRDISKIIRAQESLEDINQKLRESEERFRTLTEAATDIIVILDKDYRYIYASPSIQAMGYSPDEVIGHSPIGFIHPDDNAEMLETLEKTSRTADSVHRMSRFQVQNRDGSYTTLEGIFTNKLDHPQIQGIIFNGRDITERIRTEEILIASQKLADLGTLSAGVAHEINSPLQVITGLSDRHLRQMKKERMDTERLPQDMKVINQNAWRIVKIIRSLLSYSHTSPEEFSPQDLTELVETTLLLIEHQLKSWSNITIEKHLAADLPVFSCDRNSITQVLINLITNAADAMPDGGTITIQTSHDRENRRLRLQLADTGTGIPEEIRSRIFDPFFTTKPIGEGTGLGLSIVAGTVHALGGEIDVQSEKNEGTTINISFPDSDFEHPSLDGQGLGRFDSFQ